MECLFLASYKAVEVREARNIFSVASNIGVDVPESLDIFSVASIIGVGYLYPGISFL